MVKDEKSNIHIVFRVINKISDLLATIVAFAIFVVVIWQIVGRLIGHSAPWTEEMTRFIFIWLIFLGVGIGFRKAESARVTIFLNYTPKFIKNSSIWIYGITSIGFFLFMFVTGIELMNQQIFMGEKSSVLLLPMWIIGLSMPFSAFIGVINTIQSLIYDRDLI